MSVNPPNLESIFSPLPTEMALTSVPGLVIALTQAGESTIHPVGIKNAETHDPITAETVFPAASLSKPLFAWGVLDLVDKGLLDLDFPLSEKLRLPEADTAPQLNEITARQVLSHSTGLQNWRNGDEDPFNFAFPPGTAFRYSGEGYVYLQRVVEHITGQDIESFMQQTVLQPLGMSHSSYLWLPEYDSNLTKGHQNRGQVVDAWNGIEGKKIWEAAANGSPLPRNHMMPNVAASLLTTAGDFAHFVMRMLTTPPAGMLTPQMSIQPALSWGLGWGLAHTTDGITFWHWGDNGAFKNFVYGDPQSGDAVVIFTNGDRGLRICDRIFRRVFGVDHPGFLWL